MKAVAKGRGSHPNSRKNLRTPEREWWVYSRGAGIGWTREFGPFFQGEATDAAAKLESMNDSGLKCLWRPCLSLPDRFVRLLTPPKCKSQHLRKSESD